MAWEDTMTERDRLAALLPGILAEIDDAGSVADDWIGSRYVDELATRLLAAGVRLDEPAPGLRDALRQALHERDLALQARDALWDRQQIAATPSDAREQPCPWCGGRASDFPALRAATTPEPTPEDTMTDRERLAALPCGWRLPGGARCLAPREHVVHGSERVWTGPEPNHEYEPFERRQGGERRAGVRLDEPTPPPDALRRAAADLYRLAVGEHGHDETHSADWPACLPAHIAMNRYRDALAAAPAEPPTLDVERLARAMARCAEIGGPANHTPEMAEEHWPSYVMEATEYAREYGGMPVALDVGRLALALDRVPFDSEMTQHDLAAFIADEYARLASERRSEPRK
jgi:hypothetical protein